MRLATLGYAALRYAGVTALARRLATDGVVLCYHNVVADVPVGHDTLGLHMASATFARQIEWLAKHYTIISLDELVGRIVRRRRLRGLAALSFDDAYAGIFDHAWPLLRNLGIPATVFVVSGAPGTDREGFWWDHPAVLRAYSPAAREQWLTALAGDRATILASLGVTADGWRAPAPAPAPAPAGYQPAAWSTIAAAARAGLDIGAHSATHRALPSLDDDALARELDESRHVIRQHTGVNPVLFAYPYGLWDARVRQAVHAAGYRAAFTLNADARTRRDDPLTLPRVSVPAGISDAAFEAWAAGVTLRRHA